MKKLVFSLLFIWLLLFPALADYTVDSVSVSAEVNEKGTAQVTALTVLTFDEETDSVSIPLPVGTISGISVRDYRFKTTTDDNGNLLVTITGNSAFTGTQSFAVNYTDAAGYTADDSGETYVLNLLSSGWAKDISSFSYHVEMAGSYAEQQTTYSFAPQLLSGYFGAMDQTELTQTVSGDTADGKVTSRMAYDSVEMQIQLPAGYFKPEESLIPGVNLSKLAVIMAILWVFTIVYWALKIRTGDVQNSSTRMLAPEGLLPAELPLALDGTSCDLAALMLEWANLGYISFRCGKKKVMMVREMEMGSERSRAERELFRNVFYKKRGVLLTAGRFSAAAAKYRTASRRNLGRILFDRKGGNPAFVRIPCCLLSAAGIFWLAYTAMPTGAGYIVLAVFAGVAGYFYSVLLDQAVRNLRALRAYDWKTPLLLVLAAAIVVAGLFAGAFLESAIGILACILSACMTAPGPRRSARGRDALTQTRGCRAFYQGAAWSRLQVSSGEDPRYFQKQLPWATALRMDRRFAKHFERIGVPMPEWIQGIHPVNNSAAALQKQLTPVIRALRKAFRA